MKSGAILILIFWIVIIGCNGSKTSDTKCNFPKKDLVLPEAYDTLTKKQGNKAYLKFVKKQYDFGTIKKEKFPQIAINYEFTNTGEVPLIIYKADITCNCLSAEIPKRPINPNERDTIKVFVNTTGQRGALYKTIYIKSNASNDIESIQIKGFVK